MECSFGRDFISNVASHFDIVLEWDDCSLVAFLENWLKSGNKPLYLPFFFLLVHIESKKHVHFLIFEGRCP